MGHWGAVEDFDRVVISIPDHSFWEPDLTQELLAPVQHETSSIHWYWKAGSLLLGVVCVLAIFHGSTKNLTGQKEILALSSTVHQLESLNGQNHAAIRDDVVPNMADIVKLAARQSQEIAQLKHTIEVTRQDSMHLSAATDETHQQVVELSHPVQDVSAASDDFSLAPDGVTVERQGSEIFWRVPVQKDQHGIVSRYIRVTPMAKTSAGVIAVDVTNANRYYFITRIGSVSHTGPTSTN